MVLYFSATGNTRFIAEELASKLDDESLDLLNRIRQKDYSPIMSEKPFVICVPVYVCEMPSFINELIRNTPFEGNRDIYFVFTSGGYSGISSFLAKCKVRKKGLNYMGSADFKMPRNYIANDTYPELSAEEINRRIEVSYKLIPEIADLISSGQKLVKRSKHVWLFELIITLPFTPVWTRIRQGVKKFRATDKCIGCRKCARLCPLNVIRPDENGRPVWDAKMCAHCMSCIQNCPVEAIEYGDITPSKKRYTFDRYDFRKKSAKTHPEGLNNTSFLQKRPHSS
ncbi:MAG: EFR1 family ferrodoxin [Saccharofermentans sp.]|nr:EFR1 family ferrodoxin [Saccharofermentans sp.]